jgi:SPP1 family predicted phage head-tail adaptor
MAKVGWRAGAITQYGELYRRQGVRDEYGGMTENWTMISKLRFRMIPKRGRQTVDSDEEFDLRIVDFYMRKQHEILETDRIKFRDKYYNIDFVDEDYDEMWIRVRATRINE